MISLKSAAIDQHPVDSNKPRFVWSADGRLLLDLASVDRLPTVFLFDPKNERGEYMVRVRTFSFLTFTFGAIFETM